MNVGKFAIRFACSWPIEPELSITNSRSIFEQPSASTVEPPPPPPPPPPPFASGVVSSPPLWFGAVGPHAHAHATTPIAIDRALIIAAEHKPNDRPCYEKVAVESFTSRCAA